MDPKAVLRDLLDALETDDRDAAEEAAERLHEWIRRGGFLPTLADALIVANEPLLGQRFSEGQ